MVGQVLLLKKQDHRPPICNASTLNSQHQLPLKGKFECIFLCDSCPLGKSSRLPFQASNSVSTAPLELVHIEFWTSPHFSIKGSKYYLLFVDDYSKYSWVYPMRFKHETLSYFVKFKNQVETLFSCKIKSLQTDGVGEYGNEHQVNAFQQFISQNGISHRLLCPHTPEQNGVAERKHQDIVDTSLTLLANDGMPLEYWVEAFNTSIFLVNRLPTKVLAYLSCLLTQDCLNGLRTIQFFVLLGVPVFRISVHIIAINFNSLQAVHFSGILSSPSRVSMSRC